MLEISVLYEKKIFFSLATFCERFFVGTDFEALPSSNQPEFVKQCYIKMKANTLRNPCAKNQNLFIGKN